MRRKKWIPILSFLMTASLLCGMTKPPILDAPVDPQTSIVLCAEGRDETISNYQHWKKLLILDEDETLTSSALEPSTVFMATDGLAYDVSVEWTVTETTASGPGLHIVTGSAVCGPRVQDGRIISLADDFDGTAFWPVYRKGDDPLELTPHQSLTMSNPMIPVNASPSEILELLGITTNRQWGVTPDSYYRAGGDWTWNWDVSQIDTTIPGPYEFTGSPQTPDWISLPDDYQAAFTVFVMPTDRIELIAPIKTYANGNLEFQWLYDSSRITDAALEYQTEDDTWIPCPMEWYSLRKPSFFTPGNLHLRLFLLDRETDYTLRLTYQELLDEQATIRTTEPITLTVPSNIEDLIAEASGTVPDALDIGGDRDGGDSGGTDLPDYEQPTPPPSFQPSRPSSRPSQNEDPEDPSEDDFEDADVVYEVVTDTYTQLSGLRLEQLIGLGPTVLFEKQGVSLEIPSELLSSLSLDPYDLLTVTIQLLSETERGAVIHIDISTEDGPVTELSGAVARLPYGSVEIDTPGIWAIPKPAESQPEAPAPETVPTLPAINPPATTPSAIAPDDSTPDTIIPNTPSEPPAEESPVVKPPAEEPLSEREPLNFNPWFLILPILVILPILRRYLLRNFWRR